eukprot:COSAG06_NODE_1052_length_10949_cov_42.211797_8_plen_61_part_00
MYGLDLTFRQRDLPDKKKEKPRLRFRTDPSQALSSQGQIARSKEFPRDESSGTYCYASIV